MASILKKDGSISKKDVFGLIFICILLTFFVYCSDRIRTNPFDPLGTQSSPVSLFLVPKDNRVELYWYIGNIENYTGFRIYRASKDSSDFQIISEVSANVSGYIDSSIKNSEWYYYFVTVLGNNVESSGSNIEKVLIGPNDIWILTHYDYRIYKYSYDLLHQLDSYNLKFAPLSWTWNTWEKKVYLSIPQYGVISRINTTTAQEEIYFEGGSLRPTELCWDIITFRLYVLDPLINSIFIIENSTIRDTLSLFGDEFFKIEITRHGQLWVLGERSIIAFSQNGRPFFQLFFESEYTGMDLTSQNNTVLILNNNREKNISKIIQYDESTNNYTSQAVPGNFLKIRKPKSGEYYWLSEYLSLYSERLVKLSESGNRLLEVSDMGNITDFQINSGDNSLVLLRRQGNSVFLYDSTATLISENKRIYDPIKVFIW